MQEKLIKSTCFNLDYSVVFSIILKSPPLRVGGGQSGAAGGTLTLSPPRQPAVSLTASASLLQFRVHPSPPDPHPVR